MDLQRYYHLEAESEVLKKEKQEPGENLGRSIGRTGNTDKYFFIFKGRGPPLRGRQVGWVTYEFIYEELDVNRG